MARLTFLRIAVANGIGRTGVVFIHGYKNLVIIFTFHLPDSQDSRNFLFSKRTIIVDLTGCKIKSVETVKHVVLYRERIQQERETA